MRFTSLVAALLVCLARPAVAQVTLNANTSAACQATAATSVNCSNLTIAAGANIALVCSITWAVPVTAITLKWDNAGTPQTMALITNASVSGAGFGMGQLYGLVAPHTGALQLNAAWTTATAVYVGCTAYNGVDQTGGTTTFPNGASATGTSTTPTINITSAVNDMVHGVHTDLTNMSSCNQTQTWLDTALTHDSCSNRAAGAASVTLSANIGSSVGWGTAGASIHAAAGAAVVCRRLLMGVGC